MLSVILGQHCAWNESVLFQHSATATGLAITRSMFAVSLSCCWGFEDLDCISWISPPRTVWEAGRYCCLGREGSLGSMIKGAESKGAESSSGIKMSRVEIARVSPASSSSCSNEGVWCLAFLSLQLRKSAIEATQAPLISRYRDIPPALQWRGLLWVDP